VIVVFLPTRRPQASCIIAPHSNVLAKQQHIMPAQSDYYTTLEVSPSASPEVITSAYRSLARKYHPDANPSPDANAKMKAINAAYDVLSDPNKRAGYDRQRAAATAKSVPPQPATAPSTTKPPAQPVPQAQPATPPALEPTLFQRIVGWITSPAAGVFIIAFIIAYVALAFVTDALAPQISEDGLVLLAGVIALISTFVIRRASRR
jgi:hypothetical protein